MKKTKIGHQRTGSVLAMLTVFVLFGLALSSCESCNKKDVTKESEGTTNNRTTDTVRVPPETVDVPPNTVYIPPEVDVPPNTVYIPPENVIAKGKEFIAKAKEVIAMNDKLIVKAEAVKGKATDPQVSGIRGIWEVNVDVHGVNKDLARAEIEWVEHIINGGTKSELIRYNTSIADERGKFKSKKDKIGLKIVGFDLSLLPDPSLFPDLINAMRDYTKTNSCEYNRKIDGEFDRIRDEFDRLLMNFIIEQLP